MLTPNAICILTPTHNKTETIADVVSDYRDEGFANALVIDGGLTDGTREFVEDAGVRVAVQSGPGKGQIAREAIEDHTQIPYVLMLDDDGIYEATDATKILDPLTEGYDHIIGD